MQEKEARCVPTGETPLTPISLAIVFEVRKDHRILHPPVELSGLLKGRAKEF
jgi:hypothetical protein